MKPDIAEDHLELILAELPEHGTLLELGSGWSTVWFAERLNPTQRLVSVEHDMKWWEKIVPHVVKNLQVDYLLRPSKMDVGPYGTHHRENPAGAQPFIRAFPYQDADVVFVDGLARGACFATAFLECRAGSVIFLHDSQRTEWYEWAFSLPRESAVTSYPPMPGHPSELFRCDV